MQSFKLTKVPDAQEERYKHSSESMCGECIDEDIQDQSFASYKNLWNKLCDWNNKRVLRKKDKIENIQATEKE
jgi:hypothetical protein